MIVLGLTGSIGMGKSTAAQMFRDAGVPVHDADEAVHRLYAGKAAALVEASFPGSVTDGVVDRQELARRVLGNKDDLRKLEAIIHPLVRQDSLEFLETNRLAGSELVVLDVPLLFETGGEARVDRIAVVSAPAQIQRERVLARPGMSVEKFESILAKQMPDAEKRKRADFVIDSGRGMDVARTEIEAIVRQLKQEQQSDA